MVFVNHMVKYVAIENSFLQLFEVSLVSVKNLLIVECNGFNSVNMDWLM